MPLLPGAMLGLFAFQNRSPDSMQSVLCVPQHDGAAAAENAVRDRIGKGRVLERKPISSVLDKILSRKQEVQARSV